MVSGYKIQMSIPQVDDWSTDPRILGCHSLVSEHRLCHYLGLDGMGLEHCMHCLYHVALHDCVLC